MTAEELRDEIHRLLCQNNQMFITKYGVEILAGDDDGLLFGVMDHPEHRSIRFDISVKKAN